MARRAGTLAGARHNRRNMRRYRAASPRRARCRLSTGCVASLRRFVMPAMHKPLPGSRADRRESSKPRAIANAVRIIRRRTVARHARPHIALPQKRRDTPHYREPPAATMRRATLAPCSSPI
ncbi:hypothetical protein WS67_10575 [Burkholderia singularis]|uniref:Uncharacterized protein n=1 Tax=Burkholderia singularis TaxID=1503053 RepID=A0A118DPH8_9BURK|nr:hypothetical protein WS67_10575 [Burkholderia singularis]